MMLQVHPLVFSSAYANCYMRRAYYIIALRLFADISVNEYIINQQQMTNYKKDIYRSSWNPIHLDYD